MYSSKPNLYQELQKLFLSRKSKQKNKDRWAEAKTRKLERTGGSDGGAQSEKAGDERHTHHKNRSGDIGLF